MKYRKRTYYTEEQKALMWDRWQEGDSIHDIARLFDRYHSSVQGIFARCGGIRPPRRRRSARSLTLAEREECDEAWNIECDKRYKGVTPISPKVTQSGFPIIESFTPEFRWKPCPKQGISYDFVLYEAATYSFDQAIPRYMRGRLAAYEEGLAEARWQPDMPLKPDTRYFWSARMREGDTVSHWSTQSHSTFLLIYASWGSGQWFQFKTG